MQPANEDWPLAAQIPYAQTITADGGSETGADLLFDRVTSCLKEICGKTKRMGVDIGCVGISCFWHSLMGIDSSWNPVTPLYSWADTRSWEHAEQLKNRIVSAEYHSRTGAEIHPCFWPAKLLWLKQTKPGLFKNATRWVGFGEYLTHRLFGMHACSISMASATGLYNQDTGSWDGAVLKTIGLGRNSLPKIEERSTIIARGLRRVYAAQLPELKDAAWLAPIGDGACSNVGSGGYDSSRIVLNIGTSAAMRVTAPINNDFQLQTQPGLFRYRGSDDIAVMGGAFANGGNIYAWMKSTLKTGDPDLFAATLEQLAPDEHGLTILPFLAGERSPGWRSKVQGSVLGLTLSTTSAHMARAALEACAYSYHATLKRLQSAFPEAKTITASGGAIGANPLWAQILADVFGEPVEIGLVAEASARGAAIFALRANGQLASLNDAPYRAGAIHAPDPEHHAIYESASKRYQSLYEQNFNF
jgi:gluconokinase